MPWDIRSRRRCPLSSVPQFTLSKFVYVGLAEQRARLVDLTGGLRWLKRNPLKNRCQFSNRSVIYRVHLSIYSESPTPLYGGL